MGLRDSLVASSVWRPQFKISLERYPKFELTQLNYAVPGCDACHLGGRKSSRVGRLGGIPYDKLGFEMIVCIYKSRKLVTSNNHFQLSTSIRTANATRKRKKASNTT